MSGWRRRDMLVLAGGTLMGGCVRDDAGAWSAEWVGASVERGHRLRDGSVSPRKADGEIHRASVLVIGGGIAGLAAARALQQAGIDDVRVLELEDVAGGNSRSDTLAGTRCPLGAHYLPMPGPQAREVRALLYEFGLLKMQAGREVADERHLCHSPQERLFIDGAWVDGLLPPADPGSRTLQQYRRFAALVSEAQSRAGFALPTRSLRWTQAHAALDALRFDAWLDQHGLDDPRLRWYLDYCCRDDYGAGSAVVSAWAGLHYFGSRHGFHAPGDEDAEREPVFTWPEGNAWLAQRLADPLRDRLLPARVALHVEPGRDAVEVWAWEARTQRVERWSARQAVLATPLFIAVRLLASPPEALVQAAGLQPHAPWLVANLQLAEPLVDRMRGAPMSWDNVAFGADPRSLGYVDATHQSLRPDAQARVLTAYWSLPQGERHALLADDAKTWAMRIVADLARVHPDLPARLRRVHAMRYGHAMSIPVPGLRGHAALAALAEGAGGERVHFAHSDLAGYSVFEEAFSAGTRAGERAATALHG